jgi:cell division protein FtsQ
VARKSTSTIVQEELYPLPNEVAERELLENTRLVDLEADQESPFLRGQKRVSVRRSALPKKAAIRLKWVALAAVALAIFGVATASLYGYGKHSWRFRIDSSDQIEISGAQHVTHAQVMEVMGGDIGRNIFFVPLTQRKGQLEQIPWVESASVMRFVPNRLRVEIHERTPVAFARVGGHVSLIDAGGTLMDLAPGSKRKYSFPVILGMNSGEPLSMRAARMKNYNELVRQLDSDGAHYSQELSEVDLEDPEDVKVLVADPNGEVLVHLGTGNFLQRYKTYVTHAQQWRQQFDKLEAVDLRFDGQIVVNPDLQGIARQPTLTPAAAKAAMSAGVKPAALINYEKYVEHPVQPLPPKKSAKPVAKPAHTAKAKGKHGKVTVAANAGHPPAATHSGAGSPHAATPPKPAPAAGAPPAISAPPAGQKKPSAAIPKETAKDQR